MTKHFVYILKSQTTHRYYIGYSSDPAKRLMYHNIGANRSTKNQGPWTLVYQEELLDKSTALAREKQIKSYKGGRGFKTLLGEVA